MNVKAQHNWFGSYYFKTWAIGSIVSVVYLPLVTILTRKDPLKVRTARCFVSSFLTDELVVVRGQYIPCGESGEFDSDRLVLTSLVSGSWFAFRRYSAA